MNREDLDRALDRALGSGVYRCVLGGPMAGERFRRVALQRLEGGWQAESFTETQAFHESLPPEGLRPFVAEALMGRFSNLNTWESGREHSVRVSKKGRVLYTGRALAGKAPPEAAGHNREKRYILPQGADIPPLADMGIFTREGRVAAAMHHKYRQINRFVELIDDAVRQWPGQSLTVLDFGCGKSYLTFVLYHYLTEIRGLKVRMTGLDLKAEVIEKCNAAARRYGYQGLEFLVGDIADYEPEAPPDLVVSLHACDTATDFALYSAVRWGAGMIFAVPCCQHELNGQIQSRELGILTRYGLAQERTAALMTDVIRANLMAYKGYKTQLLEFIDTEHTPKNILIRAVGPLEPNPKMLDEALALCAAFGLRPTLLRLLAPEALAALDRKTGEKP